VGLSCNVYELLAAGKNVSCRYVIEK